MDMLLVVVLVAVVGVAAALVAIEVTRRRYEAVPVADPAVPVDEVVQQAVSSALAEMRVATEGDRDAWFRAAVEQAAVVNREQVGTAAQQARAESSAELSAKKDVIDTRLDQVHAEMRSELTKLGSIVTE